MIHADPNGVVLSLGKKADVAVQQSIIGNETRKNPLMKSIESVF